MVMVGIVVSAAHTVSIAAGQEPRPERLWDAYPLNPGEEAEPPDPAPTPTAAPERRAVPAARSAGRDDDGDGDAVVTLALIGGAAFGVGLGAGEVVRRRRRRATAAQTAQRKPAPAATKAPAARRTAGLLQAPRPPSDGVPATAERERQAVVRAPRPETRPQVRDPAAVGGIAPAPLPTDPPSSASRFARSRGWPEEAARAWTCEIDWKPGYIKSGFRAMVASPGELKRSAFGQSKPVKWTLMGDAEPPTQDMVDVLRELVIALTDNGWVRVGSGRYWYSQRFLWAGDGQPRPVAPLTGKEAHV